MIPTLFRIHDLKDRFRQMASSRAFHLKSLYMNIKVSKKISEEAPPQDHTTWKGKGNSNLPPKSGRRPAQQSFSSLKRLGATCGQASIEQTFPFHYFCFAFQAMFCSPPHSALDFRGPAAIRASLSLSSPFRDKDAVKPRPNARMKQTRMNEELVTNV